MLPSISSSLPFCRVSPWLALILAAGCVQLELLARDTDSPLADLDWLTGSWTTVDEDTVMEEHWTQPRAGTMFGVNRSIKDGVTRAFEFLRIVTRDDGVYYLASPNGRAPTAFRLVESSPTHVRFSNPEHDFPTTIEYRLVGDAM